jgi:hypothetical protein
MIAGNRLIGDGSFNVIAKVAHHLTQENLGMA